MLFEVIHEHAYFNWILIGLCLSQSAMFSGLNLALFGISRMELEIESESGNRRAQRILALRLDANFLLTTILWGNVSVNVLLALITESVLSGIAGFAFSTIVITLCGEIIPQAVFSRNAMVIGSALSPILRIYQLLLFPVAKPTALLLDWTIGKEGVQYLHETHLKDLIKKHMGAAESDLDHHEGLGALNFLALDDLPVSEEGEIIDPVSIIPMPVNLDLPILPKHVPDRDDIFLRSVHASGKKWVIITNFEDTPLLVLDADAYLREIMFTDQKTIDPYHFCFRPLVIRDASMHLGACMRSLSVNPQHSEDDVIDRDLILLWLDNNRRIITGADILGRLLRGIVPAQADSPKRSDTQQ